LEKGASRQIRLTIASRTDNTALVGLAVRGICSAGSWTEVDVYQIELCVVEAVQNAIRHAYGNDGGREVEIVIEQEQDRMEFRISDTGTPMAAWREPICPDFDPRDIGSLPEGCMGLYLIRSIMDEARYDSLDGRNTLTMIRRRPA
jgi:serine/threonine-protein kinase RsbW